MHGHVNPLKYTSLCVYACRLASDGCSYAALAHNDPRDYLAQIVFLLSTSYDVTPMNELVSTKHRSYASSSSEEYEAAALCADVSSHHISSYTKLDNPIASTFEVKFPVAFI